MTTPPCSSSFVKNFLVDIAPIPFIGEAIAALLQRFVLSTYEENKPTNSLNSIADDFFNCIEPKVGSAAVITATQLGDVLFFIVILTAVLMILIVIIFSLLDRNLQSGIIIALVIFFVLLYIIVGWILIHNSFLIISNEITNIEQITDNCVNQAITDTEVFFSEQESAILKALCAYPPPT
jgi:hypothetical protein